MTEILEAERCLPWMRACALAAQIADALGAAKRHNIVHRDIKPDNILIEHHPGGSEMVKVLDFGVAGFNRESLRRAMASAAAIRRQGTIIGTPGYMAPEQTIGEKADHRSDLYSLGVILWECIVGRQLWQADDFGSLVKAQLGADPPSVRVASEDLTIPDILGRISDHKINRLDELMPWRYAQGRG